jgi:hypothetical protein
MDNLGYFKSSVGKPLMVRIYYISERKMEEMGSCECVMGKRPYIANQSWPSSLGTWQGQKSLTVFVVFIIPCRQISG